MGFSKTISAVAKEGTMPQVRISGLEEMAAEGRRMVAAVGRDRFMLLSAHPQDDLWLNPDFM
jgi:hypothetical protein